MDIKRLEMEKALLEEHIRYGEARFRDKELVRPFVNRIYQDLAELESVMKPKTCSLCIFWDIARPRSHPNYAECNNRKCPLSYMEVHYEFGCKMFVPKDNT